MAEPGIDDEDLFADLYNDDNADNAADEPAVKAEPDPQDAADAAASAFEQEEPVIATGDNSGASNDMVKSEYQQDSYDQGMGGVSNEFRDTPADERPIGIKEDG